MKEAGMYIHIPFCMKKCDYCDFISFSGKQELIKKYIEKLKEEIMSIKKTLENYNITTIYIGGGTPSFIDSKYVTEILKELPLNLNQEITIEINPGTITENKIIEYKKAGINRISIGLQSTNNQLLSLIGRIHTYEFFLDSYNIIKKYFDNINIDLMIGLPTQTIYDVQNSLNQVIELEPKHISVYSLIVEQGTIIEEKIKSGELCLPSDKLERMMYWKTKKMLENAGFMQYEISNFSIKNYESKHNLNCWKQKEYFGFGVGAHSYINNARYSNTEDLDQYLNNKFEKIIHEKQDKNDKAKEYMILGLRTIEGINIAEFKQKFCNNPLFIYRNELNKLVNLNLIEVDENKIKLTTKGIDFANIVWEEFV